MVDGRMDLVLGRSQTNTGAHSEAGYDHLSDNDEITLEPDGSSDETPTDELPTVEMESGQDIEAQLIAEYQATILPLLIELGALKYQKEFKAPEAVAKRELMRQIEDSEREASRVAYALLRRASGTKIEKRICDFFTTAIEYIHGQTSLDGLRQFVEDNYVITIRNSRSMIEDLRSPEPTVILLNHYRQGPEIAGFPAHEVASELGEHDLAPIMAKLFIDKALEGAGITVTRFGRPLHPADAFYDRSAADAGNTKISDQGVPGLAQQFANSWREGLLPTVCPEGGLRSLRKWRTGALTAAALAGAKYVALIAQGPWISLVNNRVPFHYIGKFRIPDMVIEEVCSRDDVREITAFNNQLRLQMAQTILSSKEYDNVYKESIAAALTAPPNQ